MKKVVVGLFVVAFAWAQSVELGTIFADNDVTMLRFGGSYEFTQLNIADKKAPVFGKIAYAQGAEGFVDYSAFEFGAASHYALQDKLYAKAEVLFSFLSSSVSGVSEGTGLANTVESSDTEFTLILGAGYKITPELNAELSFGLTGLDGLRLGVAYDISKFLK